ncbi:hypothetical protein [Pseudoxanthomonas koreensis]|uniref:hypothetical protein n=1 Tax=Pseudoxanthomonas koreensis TaxID=266061 RepID=UPI0013912BB5|nr:hypothetical protein [Pseudoxanthomonas koreensis]
MPSLPASAAPRLHVFPAPLLLACLAPALLACVALPLPMTARAQAVQRCIGADGRAVYTDQKCEAIGAAARLPSSTAVDERRMFSGGCPRVLSQLVNEIGAAIQGGDVNRLASVYDWNGVSNASASRLMNRLEAIASRPLVDIAPVYPDAPYTPVAPADTATTPSAVATGVPLAVAATVPPAASAEAPSAVAGGVHRPPAVPADTAPARAGGPAAWMPSWSTGAADDIGDAGGEAPWYPDAAEPGAAVAPPPSRPRPVALRIEQTLAGSATPARTVFTLRRSYGCFWITL